MPEIKGRLIVDLHPAGTVRMVFIAHSGGGYECPIKAKNLDAAEVDLVSTCGLTPERASALRVELERNKGVSVQTSIDAAPVSIVVKCCEAMTLGGNPPIPDPVRCSAASSTGTSVPFQFPISGDTVGA